MTGMWKPMAVISLVVTALVAAGCTSDDDPRGGGGGGGPQPIAALVSFDACGDYLDWVKDAALDRVGAWGLSGSRGYFGGEGDVAMDSVGTRDMAATEAPGAGQKSAPATTAAPVPADPTSDGATSAGTDTGTNNQEAGVDEADQVKTDGKRIVALRDERLVVVDISDGSARRGADVDLGFWGGQFFLDGDRAIVFGPAPVNPTSKPMSESSLYAPMSSLTRIVEVDLSGGGAKIVATRDVEGSVVAGRFANSVVRLVISTPQPASLGFVYPQDESGQEGAEAANREAIESSTAEDWLPATVAEVGTRTPLVSCADMMHPEEFSGFTVLSVVSGIDGLDTLSATGLVADAGVTYASPTALYVATTRYPEWNEQGEVIGDPVEHTDIHRFDIATSGPALYQASGRVDGTVLNQYALSEHEDHLRIATTTNPSGGRGTPVPLSQQFGDASTSSEEVAVDPQNSRVTVLAMQGTKLVETGKVVGLGPTEQIQGVRFMGDRGYVVTFRQTDPLYVIDLADPAAPKVLGELKVTGFSDYLHPVSDTRLLGVGVDADERGGQQGGKISLYDASDPTSPKELSKLTFANAWFQAGSDPHAFTWDAEHSTATIIGSWMKDGPLYEQVTGAIVVRVEGDQLVEVGRIIHDAKATHDATSTPTTTTTPTTTEVPTTTAPPTTEAPTTTVPATTVPTIKVPEDGSGASSSAGSSGSSSGSIEPAPLITDPGAPDIAPAPPTIDLPAPPEFTIVPIERTLLAGGRLWAVSMLGLSGHDPVTLTEVAWTNWS